MVENAWQPSSFRTSIAIFGGRPNPLGRINKRGRVSVNIRVPARAPVFARALGGGRGRDKVYKRYVWWTNRASPLDTRTASRYFRFDLACASRRHSSQQAEEQYEEKYSERFLPSLFSKSRFTANPPSIRGFLDTHAMSSFTSSFSRFIFPLDPRFLAFCSG